METISVAAAARPRSAGCHDGRLEYARRPARRPRLGRATRTRNEPAGPIYGPTGSSVSAAKGGAWLVERVAAGAGTRRVRVVDREALRVDAVGEVDRGTGQVRRGHPVDDHLDATEVVDDVAIERPLVEEKLVAQAGAAARLNSDAQPKVVAAFLLEKRLHLDGRDVSELDGRRGAGLVLGLRNGHYVLPNERFRCHILLGSHRSVAA